MSEARSKGGKYVYAKDLEDIKSYVGRIFITRKNGVVKAARLDKVKGSRAYLQHVDDRVDSFSIPLNKFLDYYELLQKG